MQEAVTINGKNIGIGYRPFIIAEMSGNHNQSLNRALEIVEAAAASGVDAIKIQTYTADTMTIDINDGDFYISQDESLWRGETLYSLYQKAHTPWEWHKPIFDRCRELGLIGFSTPFDKTSVEFLEYLDVPCYKIASFENIDIPLIRTVAATGKPVIISTGMATIAELDDAVREIKGQGSQVILLKCTSTYPASPENSNLLTIPHMRKLFKCPVGISDHTLGIGVSISGVALGASVIEKHLTLSRAEGGVDSAFSLELAEMRMLVQECRSAALALGSVSYGPTDNEVPSLKFRRSLYITKDMRAGEVLTEDNLRAIRPGGGLAPKYLEIFLGKKVSCNLKRGTPVSWDIINS